MTVCHDHISGGFDGAYLLRSDYGFYFGFFRVGTYTGRGCISRVFMAIRNHTVTQVDMR